MLLEDLQVVLKVAEGKEQKYFEWVFLNKTTFLRIANDLPEALGFFPVQK